MEEAALYDLVDERAHAESLWGCALQNLVQFSAVGEEHRRAGRERHESPGPHCGRGSLRPSQPRPGRPGRPAVCPVASTQGAIVEGEGLTIHTEAPLRLHGLSHGAVSISTSAHHVKVFKREARRIHLGMGGRGRGVCPVLGELLFYGGGAPNIRLDQL